MEGAGDGEPRGGETPVPAGGGQDAALQRPGEGEGEGRGKQ